MKTTKRWTIEILLDEVDETRTRAVARLDTSEDAHVHGQGSWEGEDGDAAEIGDDIAVSRALGEIAEKLSVRPRRRQSISYSAPADGVSVGSGQASKGDRRARREAARRHPRHPDDHRASSRGS